MSLDQVIIFAIIGAMMALFIWNRLRYDLIAALGLLTAMGTGIVPVSQAFLGFADQVVIIVASALIVSAGIGKSNVIAGLIRRLQPAMTTTGRQVAVLTVSVTVLSSLMKNVGALAVFLPIAVQMARRTGTPPSKLLMPMAFGSLIGGLVTLVGTSPNILVSRVRAEILGMPFRMFDFAPVGLAIVVAGLAFLLVGWRLLPGDRRGRTEAEGAFNLAPYLFEASLPPASPLVGKTIGELEALGQGEVAVVAIVRENTRRHLPTADWRLSTDDLLVIQSHPHALRRFVDATKLDLGGSTSANRREVAEGTIGVVEAVVTPNSLLVECSSADLHLRSRHGLSLIAISRQGQDITTHLRDVPFQAGDVLVLQGNAEVMLETLKVLGCLPLVDRGTGLGRSPRDVLPLFLLAGAMAAVTLGLIPVTAAFFGAAVLTALLGVLTLKEAYDALDLPILVLLACMIPVSDAINQTGGADLMAGGLAVLAGKLPPAGAVSMVLVAAMAVTPFLNNAATVLIMAPVGASLARKLGLNPDPFLMAVAVGAACDFLTPIGHQCNTLVMGPGGYRFGDYWKLGLPLSIIVVIVGSVLIPLFWPLTSG
ncbi:MAG TPA: SLC13 family permease [Magnetospirillum sp.]|nr:SLC13 family permease [Magnetospirillum sp.]